MHRATLCMFCASSIKDESVWFFQTKHSIIWLDKVLGSSTFDPQLLPATCHGVLRQYTDTIGVCEWVNCKALWIKNLYICSHLFIYFSYFIRNAFKTFVRPQGHTKWKTTYSVNITVFVNKVTPQDTFKGVPHGQNRMVKIDATEAETSWFCVPDKSQALKMLNPTFPIVPLNSISWDTHGTPRNRWSCPLIITKSGWSPLISLQVVMTARHSHGSPFALIESWVCHLLFRSPLAGSEEDHHHPPAAAPSSPLKTKEELSEGARKRKAKKAE